MEVLVTGASGFIGNGLVKQLLNLNGVRVKGCARSVVKTMNTSNYSSYTMNLVGKTDWSELLDNIDVVVHCAARADVMHSQVQNPLEEFRKINTHGTLNLATQAARTGVKRFVFISSVKVNGEVIDDKSFSPEDNLSPNDPYGLSKYEAEQGLLTIAKDTKMEVVIIRPPLVYGPGVKANFASMMKWVNKGLPLPLGTVNNKRSLIALDNLIDFICLCADYKKTPKAANQVFLISDDEDVSTTELLRKIALSLDKKVRLISFPVVIMTFFARLFGKRRIADSLLGNLHVDCSKAKELLDWAPIITMDEQLKKTADAFLRNEKSF